METDCLAIEAGSSTSSTSALILREDNRELAQIAKTDSKSSSDSGFRKKKKLKAHKEKMPKVYFFFYFL